ncbi:MAG: hypothetical protein FJ299_16710, partial [Planctomycetes bacterium]|nr:hypothetical protein [Planctomycetota bacterium]
MQAAVLADLLGTQFDHGAEALHERNSTIGGMIAAGLFALAQEPLSAAPDFERDVRPILAAHCYSCHGEQRQRGALRLDLHSPRLFESVRGREPVLVAGDVEQSPLYQRVVSTDAEERMPLEQAPLSAAQVDLLQRWIEAGAAWPTSATADAATLTTHWA